MIIIVIIIVIIVIIYIMFSIISTDIIILRNIILLNLACSRRIRPRRRLYMIIIINFICVDIIPIILILILQRPDGFCSGAPSSVFCCYRRWRRTLDHLILSLFFQ